MRKSVTYLFDVCVDRNAVIVECQCECRAGMGPDAHSKHVRTVLWALIYHGDGQALLTEETCTQRLQSCHRVKKHTGSPVKCQTLKLRKSTANFYFGPRPCKYVKNGSYPSYVRNLAVNF